MSKYKYRVIQAPDTTSMLHLVHSRKALEVYCCDDVIASLPFYSYEQPKLEDGYHLIEYKGYIKLVTFDDLRPIVVLERLEDSDD